MNENDRTGLDYLLPDRVYGVLKWLALIALPAVAVFVQVVGPSWGLPHVDQIVTTIDAIGVLIGTLIGVSEIKAKLTLAA
ncbi:phage holin [uncultured Bifidobacterium sp.]|uniref:phage holin n=1 Tax=uncultured Bifidobacterium sp. TaxID=165187 RepID=UPI002614819C|nr:phage holin [uncultured Bifidobacterium sp.]